MTLLQTYNYKLSHDCSGLLQLLLQLREM